MIAGQKQPAQSISDSNLFSTVLPVSLFILPVP